MTNLMDRLADAVPSWGAKLAYGESTTINGRELIPVALVVFGFGAGEGSGEQPDGGDLPPKHGEGSAGGGGGYTIPVGAYVSEGDGVIFHANPIALLAVAIPLISVTGWALSRILHATR